MRCGAVPILVALAKADQRTVTHIDGNEKLLARLCGNRSLAEDHLIYVYVVVNGLKSLDSSPAEALKNDLCHLCAVSLGKLLADIHVVKIVLHKGTVEIAEVVGECRLLCIVLLLKRLDGCLNLTSSALLLIGADDLLTPPEIILLTCIEINGDLLIKLGYLRSEITASRVNDKVLTALLVHVDLDKVVTAAKRAGERSRRGACLRLR